MLARDFEGGDFHLSRSLKHWKISRLSNTHVELHNTDQQFRTSCKCSGGRLLVALGMTRTEISCVEREEDFVGIDLFNCRPIGLQVN